MDNTTINVADISVPERLRELDQDWVTMLAGMIAESGMINPISVRKDGDTTLLVTGAHRLAAVTQNGEEMIAITWSKANTETEARLEEVLENLGRNELTVLDRARHLFEFKKAFEKLNPDIKWGGDRKSDEAIENQSANIALWSEAADKTGLGRRSIFAAIALWKNLTVDSRTRCQGTPLADHQAGLVALSKVGTKMQKKILDVIFDEGNTAKTVPEAVEFIENGKLIPTSEKQMAGVIRSFKKLDDATFHTVLSTQIERVRAWYKEHGEDL